MRLGLKKHNRVVDAMRAVDPSIVPVAVGAVGDWSKQMLTGSIGHMGLLSEHTYWQNKPDVAAHVEQASAGIRSIAEAHRAYRRELPSLKGKDMRLALDESEAVTRGAETTGLELVPLSVTLYSLWLR
jgi:alpha-N-arabinofuranosidase